MPVSLMRAQTLERMGDLARARASYDAARALLEDSVAARPRDPRMRIALGLAYAGLHRRSDAMREARSAIALAPVSAGLDASTVFRGGAVEIYTRLGEADAALALIELLFTMPAGREISVPLLRLDPTFDLLRSDPRFHALLTRFTRVHLVRGRRRPQLRRDPLGTRYAEGNKHLVAIQEADVAFIQGNTSEIRELARYEVRPEALEQCLSAIHEFVAYVRSNEPGALRYEVWQESEHPTRFVHIFIWRDEAANRIHGESAAVKKFAGILYPNCLAPVEFIEYKQIDANATFRRAE